MKTLIATSLMALLVAATAAANAAGAGTPVIPGATTGTISTPYAQGGRGSEALPIFNYRGAAPLMANLGQARAINISPWNVDLAHQSGGSR